MNSSALTNLGKIKKDLISGKDRTLERFTLEVANAIDNHLWCYFPATTDSKGTQIKIVEYHGKTMIAAYSSEQSKKIAPDMICTDINKIVDVLYSNKDFCGIVFDLNDSPIEITRNDIDRFSNRKDKRLQKRDWGNGIPKYTNEDIMTKDELFDFGMQIVTQQINKEGYTIIHTENNYRSVVNIVAIKNKKKYYISVKTTIAPEIAKLNDKDLDRLKEICKNENALPLFVPIGFGSIDSERFTSSLALIGDGFNCRYTGIEEI